jgi:hypothetical protein
LKIFKQAAVILIRSTLGSERNVAHLGKFRGDSVEQQLLAI